MRVVFVLALFLFSSLSAGEGSAENTLNSLDANFKQLHQNCNLQQADFEDLDEDFNLDSFHSSKVDFPHSRSYLTVHGYKFGRPSDSSIRAPPVHLN